MAHADPFLSMVRTLRKAAGKTIARTGEIPEREKISTQYCNDQEADSHLFQSVAIEFCGSSSSASMQLMPMPARGFGLRGGRVHAGYTEPYSIGD
ncbi:MULTISPECIES: hypothetical protein [unclassified Bradyrhizobium]|uniref:hypothetical protein n=1 Tax=unclassified Bradyrhizobium TaxID=2631580 RepID=UPI0012EB1431|nr:MULTISPECIES: hypothetical protein [unclassified Bradyrhizobium]QIG96658.1 hypothetical protein G6P99_32475 [Bradyrhizobium sp. 6(2017)]